MRANGLVFALLALKEACALLTFRTRVVPRRFLAQQVSSDRKVVSLKGVADRPDIQRAMEFLLMDEAARNEKDGAGLSLEEKEEALGGNDSQNEMPSAPETLSAAEVNADKSSTEAESNTSDVNTLEAEAGSANLAMTSDLAMTSEEDAVLGKLVADLGDKRIYLATVPQLIRIPVWEKQRVYRRERSKAIAMEKLRRRGSSDSSLSFPGVVTVYEKAWVEPPVPPAEGWSSEDEMAAVRARYGVVDGQHRVGALRELLGRGEWRDGQRVLMEVLPLPNEIAVAELFTDINKAEPVKDVDLPGVASTDERDILASSVSALRTAYPEMFKDSSKCKKPHVHIDTLRDDLFTSGALGRHGGSSSEEDDGEHAEASGDNAAEFLAWLRKENDKLAERPDKEWLAAASKGRKGGIPGPAFEKALAKARAFGFFLGMDSEWLKN